MRGRGLYFCVITLLFVYAFMSPTWAMPPHPDLLEKIKLGQVQEPFFFKNIEILREKGIDTPAAVAIARQIAAGDLKANFNAIAILVDFSDNTSNVSASYFDNLMFGTGTGTLRDYWEEATYGNLTVVTVDQPSSVGWLRAPNTYSYYVDGYYGFGSYPRNAQRLCEDVVNLADPYVDFSDYDNDSDGYVDALFIIHADQGAEYTGSVNDIWSHKWSTYNVPYVDGVYCYIYSMEPEYWASPGDMTCGVYAHEMGHSVFGLPDLYDYDYDSEGLGDWSLMAGGSWNGPLGASPAHPDAYCRILTGAATATNLTSNLMGASIPAVENTPTIYRLWTNGAGGSEYFLVENRRQTGYDSYLDSQGLMIYHVDETQYGNDNQWYPGYTSYGNYEVALEQADGDWDLEKNVNDGDNGDPYPGSSNNRTFDKNTTPDSEDYGFDTTMVAVRNISNSAATMTADLYVTVGDTPDPPSITVTYPNGGETLSTSATITWTATDPDPGETALLDIDLDYSSNGGGSWTSIAAGESNDGSYLWDISGLSDGSNYLVRATATDPSMLSDSDESNSTFTIYHPDDPSIAVTYPNGGETLSTSTTITWTATDPDPGETALLDIDLDYSSNGGGSWTAIATGESNDGSSLWDISGLPDGSNYLVRATATDPTMRSDTDQSDATFTIDNPDAPSITVTYPNGGETIGVSTTITWSATDPDPGETALLDIDLDYSSNGGGSWTSIATGETNDGSYFWDISGLPDGSNYLVRATATDPTMRSDSDESNSTFTIDNPDDPSITVTYPNGGENLSGSATITWNATDPDPGETALLDIDLDYSDNGGGSWTSIATGESNDGSYLWDVFGLSDGSNYLVRATAKDPTMRSDTDQSDAVFTIDNPDDPSLTVTYPNGGETIGVSTTITWTATDPDPGETALLDIDLDYSSNDGGSWTPISTGETNDGSYFWDISGLPDGSNYLVRATATDPTMRSDSDESNSTFTIDNPDAPSIAVTYPNGGENLGGSTTITWNATDSDPGETAALLIDLEYSDNGGGSWNSIVDDESNDGSYLWDISGLPDGSNYLVRATATDPTARSDEDISDGIFTIYNPGSPDVTVIYPDGGEGLSGSATITWTATDPDPGETALLDIDLDYSSNGGGSWTSIAMGETNDGSYLWDVSGLADGSNYLVRATATDPTMLSDSDESNTTFTIDNPDPPSITVTSPNGEETLSESATITWNATDPDPGETALLSIDLDYSDNGGGSWTSIATDETNDGSYLWDISGLSDGSNYMVRVTATDTTEASDNDQSDGTFAIDNPEDPSVTVTHPNGGETLADSVTITWNATDPDPGETALLLIDLDYSDNGGGSWSSIDVDQVNDGTYFWDISGLPNGSNYMVRVTAIDTTSRSDFDVCDDVFTILNTGLPAAITDLMTTLSGSAIHLSWSAVTEDEGGVPISVDHYVVYRSNDPGFSPIPADSIGNTGGTSYDDPTPALKDTGTNHYYVVKAVDAMGRKSADSNMAGEFDVDLLSGTAK